MAAEDLAQPADVEAFDGAPFDDAVLTAAGERVRGICGWHIAPSITETVRLVSTSSGPMLFVDTMLLTAVTAVRDVTDGGSTELDGFTFEPNGTIYRGSGWGSGRRVFEVDIEHGFDTCPPAVAKVVAEIARASDPSKPVTSKQLGSAQISYGSSSDADGASPLDPFTLVSV